LAIEVGDTQPLTATVLPDNAADKSVTWTSSNESVAIVDNGSVTGVSVGNATITAQAGDCTVVDFLVEHIQLADKLI